MAIVPYIFGTHAAGSIPASELDDNFAAIEAVLADSDLDLLTDVRLPNQFLRSNSNPANTGSGGASPFWGLQQAFDMPILDRDGTKKFGRRVQDVLRDHGTSFDWYRNRALPLDDTVAFGNAISEGILVLDTPTIYLSSEIDIPSNTNIVSLLGDNPVTFVQRNPAAKVFNFTDSARVRFWGKFRIRYEAPPGSTTKALYFLRSTNVFIDDMAVENCGQAAVFDTGTHDIAFNRLRSDTSTGDAVVFSNGRDVTFARSLEVETSDAGGIVVSSGWDGGISANLVRVTGCQDIGLEYSSGGALDQVTDLRISNSGLSASGTLAGLYINSTSRDFRVLGGEIGQDAAGSGVTQGLGVYIEAGATRVAIGTNLIGNTAAYTNLSVDDVCLSGVMPAGTAPVYSPAQQAAIQAFAGGPVTSTYTPAITFATPGDSTFAVTTAVGYVRKAGTLVFVEGVINIAPSWTTASGNIQVSLPYTAANPTGGPQPTLQIAQVNSNVNWGASNTMLQGRVQNNAAFFLLSGAHSAATSSLLTTASLTAGTGSTISFNFSGSYIST